MAPQDFRHEKTKVVIFKEGVVQAPSSKVSIQGQQKKYATQSTALGITIDNKLTFNTQFEKSKNNAKAAFASFYSYHPIF